MATTLSRAALTSDFSSLLFRAIFSEALPEKKRKRSTQGYGLVQFGASPLLIGTVVPHFASGGGDAIDGNVIDLENTSLLLSGCF